MLVDFLKPPSEILILLFFLKMSCCEWTFTICASEVTVISCFDILVLLLSIRYGESFHVSDEVLDSSFCLSIGKAKVCFPVVMFPGYG